MTCGCAQVTTPLMMIHAEDDEIIPYDLGRKVSMFKYQKDLYTAYTYLVQLCHTRLMND
jgi:predicted esterase